MVSLDEMGNMGVEGVERRDDWERVFGRNMGEISWFEMEIVEGRVRGREIGGVGWVVRELCGDGVDRSGFGGWEGREMGGIIMFGGEVEWRDER